jgi:hypothetical protein
MARWWTWRRVWRLVRDPQEVRRLLTLRCDYCGHKFRWARDARHSFGNGDGKVWHDPCIALVIARGKAEERLEVIGVMAELSGLTASDVRNTMSLRDEAGQPGSGSNGWDRAWRVFYDLEKSTPTPRQEPGDERTDG